MSIEMAYKLLLGFALGVLTLLALACLVRCILGPRISDRVLAINVTGTITVIMVALTVLLLGEGGYWFYLSTRLVKNLLLLPLEVAVLYAVLKALQRVLPKK